MCSYIACVWCVMRYVLSAAVKCDDVAHSTARCARITVVCVAFVGDVDVVDVVDVVGDDNGDGVVDGLRVARSSSTSNVLSSLTAVNDDVDDDDVIAVSVCSIAVASIDSTRIAFAIFRRQVVQTSNGYVHCN